VDWPKVRPWLLAQVRDLLPEADLVPQEGPANPAEGRTLASIPVRVRPGRVALKLREDGSPLLFSVKLAGVGALAAVLAVGLLLMGALTLSRRRAAFVSSVTHELRTPLTTFRMYTEMLTDGMATDPERLADYHQVLRTEAERLSHLVENVLAYARLERGRYGVVEEVVFAEALERVVPRLREHAGQAGMELVLEPGDADGNRVRLDAGALERILFNLVDNAGKYAREAPDRRIHLAVRREGRWMGVTVRDHGPGVRAHRRGLFRRAFRKSAGEAARTAPGVGIGLALSRRLARAMGGRLRLVSSSPDGAAFRLDLPVSRESKHKGAKTQEKSGEEVE
jgi:signal transduction histidine kinase